jgi:hypothetical protein
VCCGLSVFQVFCICGGVCYFYCLVFSFPDFWFFCFKVEFLLAFSYSFVTLVFLCWYFFVFNSLRGSNFVVVFCVM